MSVLWGLAGLFGVGFVGCRFRVFPIIVMRAWFALWMVILLFSVSVATFFTNSLKHFGVSKRIHESLSMTVAWMGFAALVRVNPHIHVTVLDSSPHSYASMPGGSVLLLNHTSFWDPLLFTGTAPISYIYSMRTMFKESLRRLPIFGATFDRCGHFPVYFVSEEASTFSVQKEKQQKVAEDVDRFVKELGHFAFFPEGMVNRQSRTLAPFRYGSFKLVAEHNPPVYYGIAVGNDDSWPPGAAVGGLPADIFIATGKIEYDKNLTPEELSEFFRGKMQRALDELYRMRDAARSGKKKSQ